MLAGSASGYEDVTRYASGLRASGEFADVKVVRVEKAETSGLPGSGPEGGARTVTFLVKASVGPAPDGQAVLPASTGESLPAR